jgi:hypothetical protein
MLRTVNGLVYARDPIVFNLRQTFYVMNIHVFWDLALYCVVSSSNVPKDGGASIFTG